MTLKTGDVRSYTEAPSVRLMNKLNPPCSGKDATSSTYNSARTFLSTLNYSLFNSLFFPLLQRALSDYSKICMIMLTIKIVFIYC